MKRITAIQLCLARSTEVASESFSILKLNAEIRLLTDAVLSTDSHYYERNKLIKVKTLARIMGLCLRWLITFDEEIAHGVNGPITLEEAQKSLDEEEI